MNQYGYKKHHIKNMIEYEIKKNPDIFYYMDNQYIETLVHSIVEGVSEAIAKNNEKLINDLMKKLNKPY